MFSLQIIGVFFALSSAIFYGSADFCGGVATRRISQYQVLALSAFIGILAMALLAILWREKMPSQNAIQWGIAGGFCGAIGLASLYRGLSQGHAAIVSPVSGVIGAVLPVLFAIFTTGLPTSYQIIGIAIAIPGIWLVTLTSEQSHKHTRSNLLLGILAGVAFGFTFIFFARIGRESVFAPLAIAKIASFLVALLLLRSTKLSLPPIKGNLMAVLAGVLDPCANALFVMSTSYTRLDIAVVLTTLYPAATVFLSRWFLKETISYFQWAGVALCVLSIILITFSPV